jgi:predicted RNA-binding protein YlxR (DUF448 family)
MRQRKIPLRKCVACQQMMPKKELIRVVRTPQDEVAIDLTGKKIGPRCLFVREAVMFQAGDEIKGA